MPKLLSYDVDDDEAAEQYVRGALRRSQRSNWKALIADDRIMQTYRALCRIEARAAQAHIRHREAIRQAEIDRDAGLISDIEFAEEYGSFVNWRQRASVFDGILRQYRDMVLDRVWIVRRDPVVDCLRRSLLTLALAVDAHRDAHAGEESLADTALWARLSTLTWPVSAGAEFRTLADAVAAERARRGPARINSDAFIEFEGLRVFGETVDVANLILELTDHIEPSISRPTLIELWKQRTPDLIDTAAAKATTDRQVGNYASHRLRKALLFLENLAVIAREAEEASPRITVTDRAKLGELRRRWDDTYFEAYGLGR
ncbi:hypothetical protein [Amycolatopsis sp. cmx-11-12]|uniref:hypothetical protein n=1 Tax=Amycolatopsis sp. cmx-11-12 TaxID=2785795 RepID=UPI003917D297